MVNYWVKFCPGLVCLPHSGRRMNVGVEGLAHTSGASLCCAGKQGRNAVALRMGRWH